MKKSLSKKEATKVLEDGAKKIKDEDLRKVIARADEIEEKFKAHGPLGRFIQDVKILISMVRDYFNGTYREVPWWTIAAVVTTLLYVLNPADLIPDFIPVIGYVDDAAVVAVCLAAIEQDLAKYREWKIKQAR